MIFKPKTKKRFEVSRTERGTAMLEFGAILPIIVLMLISTIEIGNAINQFLTVSRISYEATRYAASLAGLEPGTTVLNETPPSAIPEFHAKVLARVSRLLQDYQFSALRARVEVSLIEPTGGATYRLAKVEVMVPVRPIIFDQYSWINLRASAWAPYLYLNSEI